MNTVVKGVLLNDQAREHLNLQMEENQLRCSFQQESVEAMASHSREEKDEGVNREKNTRDCVSTGGDDHKNWTFMSVKQEENSVAENISFIDDLLEMDPSLTNAARTGKDSEEHYCSICEHFFPPLNILRKHFTHLYEQGLIQADQSESSPLDLNGVHTISTSKNCNSHTTQSLSDNPSCFRENLVLKEESAQVNDEKHVLNEEKEQNSFSSDNEDNPCIEASETTLDSDDDNESKGTVNLNEERDLLNKNHVEFKSVSVKKRRYKRGAKTVDVPSRECKANKARNTRQKKVELLDCEICHKQFRNEVGLKVHITKIHAKQDQPRNEFHVIKRGIRGKTEENHKPDGESIEDLDVHMQTLVDLKVNIKTEDLQDTSNSIDDITTETSSPNGIDKESDTLECATNETKLPLKPKGDFSPVPHDKKIHRVRRRMLGRKKVSNIGVDGVKRPYECDECSRRFRSPSHLASHRSVHSDARPFQCKICSQRFKVSSSLKVHQILHKRTSKNFACLVCDKSFYSAKALELHVQIHNTECLYKCDQCDKSYPSYNQLYVHSSIHKVRLLCNVCGRVFHRKSHLNEHLRTHTDHKPEACPECGRKFRTKSQVKIHMRSHAPHPMYMCETCGKQFRNLSGLKGHMFEHVEGVKPHPCRFCEKSFGSPYALKSHMDVHNRVRKFLCAFCDKKFIRKSNLQEHTQKMHKGKKKRLWCEECNVSFSDHNLHKQHMDGHSGRARPYKCTLCERCFITAGVLKRHYKLSHYQDQSHQCDVCKKSFTFVDDLKRHRLTHSSDRAYVCDVCNWRFVRKAHLDRHIGTVHRDRTSRKHDDGEERDKNSSSVVDSQVDVSALNSLCLEL